MNLNYLLFASHTIHKTNVSTIIDKTVEKVSTFDVFIASLPFPLFNVVQNGMVLVGNCCVTLQQRVLLTTTFVYDCRFRCLAAQAVSTSTIARKSSLKELFSQLNLESD